MLKWLACLSAVLAGVVLLLAARHIPGFAAWYAANVFPVFPHTAGRVMSLLPFSVFEVVLVLLVLALLCGAAYVVYSLFGRTGRARLRGQVPGAALRLFAVLSCAFLMFVLTAGINYSRESFADHIGITVRDSTADELVRLYIKLAERAAVLSREIETDSYGHFVLHREGIHGRAIAAMHGLCDMYGGLGSYFPRAKAPVLSRLLLSNMNIGGFFSPWTVEAHYNGDMPGQSIPFVIVHELAHAAGHMREDEANFVAYLAAANSDCIGFRYSAVYAALTYTLQALHRAVGAQRYAELFALLPEQVVRDMAYARAYWRSFDGRAAEVATRANDTYLRLNRQEDGVQSYGRMVDLLLAYYRD